MDSGAANLIPDANKALFALLSTWVLFAVFVACALAFILMILGLRKPDPTTQKYLFGVFSVSVIGIFTSLVTNSLNFSPSATAQKFNAAEQRSQAVADAGKGSKMTVFTQIGSSADVGTYDAIKKALSQDKYRVTAVDNVGFGIGENQIRYCNPANAKDASDLSDALKAKGVGTFRVLSINGCSPDKNKNILEVWVKTS